MVNQKARLVQSKSVPETYLALSKVVDERWYVKETEVGGSVDNLGGWSPSCNGIVELIEREFGLMAELNRKSYPVLEFGAEIYDKLANEVGIQEITDHLRHRAKLCREIAKRKQCERTPILARGDLGVSR